MMTVRSPNRKPRDLRKFACSVCGKKRKGIRRIHTHIRRAHGIGGARPEEI